MSDTFVQMLDESSGVPVIGDHDAGHTDVPAPSHLELDVSEVRHPVENTGRGAFGVALNAQHDDHVTHAREARDGVSEIVPFGAEPLPELSGAEATSIDADHGSSDRARGRFWCAGRVLCAGAGTEKVIEGIASENCPRRLR